jgi:GMP synthase-like glutamine amidotransferase
MCPGEPEMPGRQGLVIEQQATAPAGLIGEWVRARDLDVEVVRARDQGGLRGDPTGFRFIVALGSEHAAYDRTRGWIREQLRFLDRAVAARVPVLGICFGAQALAVVLGARVARAPHPEVGWTSVESFAPELIAEGPWFSWHFDSFEVPHGARLLARNEHSIQAFSLGPHVAVQFHPEVTPRIITDWLTKTGRSRLINLGVDEARIQAETARNRTAAHRVAMDLFDAWYATLPPALRGASGRGRAV